MSSYSQILLWADRAPSGADINAALAANGVALVLDPQIRLDRDPGGMVKAEFEGRTADFEIGVEPAAALIESGRAPASIAALGDLVVGFESHGVDAAQAVLHLEAALSRGWKAWGLAEDGSVTAPELHAKACAQDAASYHAAIARLESAAPERLALAKAHAAQLREADRPRTLSQGAAQIWSRRGPEITGWLLAGALLIILLLVRP